MTMELTVFVVLSALAACVLALVAGLVVSWLFVLGERSG